MTTMLTPAQEQEAQQYAKSFNCDIETARRDVADEYGQTLSSVDAFIERSEMADIYSDLYKDRYGFRPRAELARASAEGWTVQDFRDEIAKLPPLEAEESLCEMAGEHPNAKWVDMGDEMVLVCPDCGNHVG